MNRDHKKNRKPVLFYWIFFSIRYPLAQRLLFRQPINQFLQISADFLIFQAEFQGRF